jgi:hypothetical protein
MSHVPADEEGGAVAMQENLEEILAYDVQMETDAPDFELESVRKEDLSDNVNYFEKNSGCVDAGPRVNTHFSKQDNQLSCSLICFHRRYFEENM